MRIREKGGEAVIGRGCFFWRREHKGKWGEPKMEKRWERKEKRGRGFEKKKKKKRKDFGEKIGRREKKRKGGKKNEERKKKNEGRRKEERREEEME